jgi:hypothetical protein
MAMRIRGDTFLRSLILAYALLYGLTAYADMGSFVTTTQSLDQRPAGSSEHTALDDISGRLHPYSLTLFSIVSGPTVTNLGSDPVLEYTPSGRPVYQPTGYSLRQQATGGYHLSEDWVLGPVVNFSDSFYGATDDQIMLGDVQMQLTRLNAFEGKLLGNDFRVHWMLGADAPISENAHDLHMEGGVSETIIGRLNLKNSRFNIAGTVGSRTSFYHQGPFVADTKISSGVETSYHHSASFTSFVMSSIGGTAGPSVDMTSRTNLSGQMPSHIFGLTSGLRVKATDFISFSPFVNWFTDGPLSNSTIGLTTNIQLI